MGGIESLTNLPTVETLSGQEILMYEDSNQAQGHMAKANKLATHIWALIGQLTFHLVINLSHCETRVLLGYLG